MSAKNFPDFSTILVLVGRSIVLVWLFLERSESSGVGLGAANWIIKKTNYCLVQII